MLGSWVRAPSRSPQNLRESRPKSGFRCFSAVCVFQSYANYLKILLFTQQILLFSSPAPSPADKIPSPRGTESAILTNFFENQRYDNIKIFVCFERPQGGEKPRVPDCPSSRQEAENIHRACRSLRLLGRGQLPADKEIGLLPPGQRDFVGQEDLNLPFPVFWPDALPVKPCPCLT